jgi:hypothetical protein
MTIQYSDLPAIKKKTDIKSKIIALLLSKGGLLTAHECIRSLQETGALPENYDRAKYLLYHHCRESYYLQREKGDIIRLIPIGKDDTRLWTKPLDAPDVTSFIFSLLVMERERNLTYAEAIPFIREYIGTYENQYHVDCPGKSILTSVNGGNTFYTLKKQVKHFLTAKGIL